MPVCYRHPDRESHIRCQRCDRRICPDCMRDAAVGFQCPACVAQGAKTTRSNRTTYGGIRPTDASVTSIALIVVNVAVWAAVNLTGGRRSRLVDYLAIRPDSVCADRDQSLIFPSLPESACATVNGATWVPSVADGAYWQLITNAFTHIDLVHIGLNMLLLYLLGPQLEALLGRSRFLALYLLSALTASATVYWLSAELSPTLGASGAVYGLLGALLVIGRKAGRDVQFLMIMVAFGFAYSFTRSDISWQGHLGGLIGGAVVATILAYAPKPHRTRFQVGLLLGLTAVVALVVVARSVVLV